VFVEWPLERNLKVVREMTALAAKHNSKTMVGIQGSFPSIMHKMKELIEGGRIGKILSSSILAHMSNGGATEVKNVRYFLDRDIGGNVLSIRFGHAIECITCGEFIWAVINFT
jgi:predicted dehydrogenase